MESFVVKNFWRLYHGLPVAIQKIAKEKFLLWQKEPFHPSLQFKLVSQKKNIWSARINDSYRALGIRDKEQIVWYWIGNHDEYERRLK
jgi:hypothetical protein